MGIALGDRFGYAVSLSGDRSLIGDYISDEKCVESEAAYIFCRMNGL